MVSSDRPTATTETDVLKLQTRNCAAAFQILSDKNNSEQFKWLLKTFLFTHFENMAHCDYPKSRPFLLTYLNPQQNKASDGVWTNGDYWPTELPAW